MNERKFKVGDEVFDRARGWRGRIDRVDPSTIIRSYDVWFHNDAVGAVRAESDIELVSVIDRLGDLA